LQGLVSKDPEALDTARSFLKRECVSQTLKLTGTDVSAEDVKEAVEGRAEASAALKLIQGQLEALEWIERVAESEREMETHLIVEVHRLSCRPGGGRFRTNVGISEFVGVVPSRPELIAEKVEDLLVWLRCESGRSLHPPERATLFFTRFLEIGPFESGNFRAAHLLMNYFGFDTGYPPFFFQVEDSKKVRSEIERAMSFDTEPLVVRIAGAMNRSLDICMEFVENKNEM
jgi:Fic family protein